MIEKGLPTATCLNVNFPNEEIIGLKVCEQAKGYWSQEWEPCPRKGDENYFWLTGKFVDIEPENANNDRWALHHGYGAITPIQVDLTNHTFIKELSNWF